MVFISRHPKTIVRASGVAGDVLTIAPGAASLVFAPPVVADGAVTYAKIQDVSATDKVLGRATAGPGDIEEIACTAAGRALIDDADAAAQRTTLGLGSAATTSSAAYDAAGSAAAAQAASQPLDADLTAIAALTSAADKVPYSTGAQAWALATLTPFARTLLDDADDVAARLTLGIGVGSVLSVSGTAPIASSGGATPAISLNDGGVSDAKLRNSGALSIIGRSANTAGVPADISATAASGAVMRESGSVIGFGTIATAGIADTAVTYAKVQNVSATDRILGRSTAGAGVIEEITCTAFARSVLDDVDAAAVRATIGAGTGSGTVTNVTGTAPISSTGGATPAISLDAGGVTNAKLADMAVNTIKGRVTAGTGVPEDLTAAQGRTVLGLGTAALSATGDFEAAGAIAAHAGAADPHTGYLKESDVTAAGLALIDDVDAAAQRTTLGLGTLATQSGTFSGTSSGTNTGDQTTVSGNAGTATALQTPRAINGTNFDGTAPITITAAGSTLTGSSIAAGMLGTTATTACAGNDARLSDSRTPNTHATSHKSGGSDAIKLDELAATTDVTTLNATTTAHGLLRKLDGLTTTFLRGDGTWAAPSGGPGGSPTFTSFTKDLGASKRSGTFDITGLSGLTAEKVVSLVQTAGQIASKGNARDESEFDSISLTGYVVDTTTIRAFWKASGVVVGTYEFAYMVSG